MIAPRQWLGLVLGFVGVVLVVSNKLGGTFGLDALWPVILALLGITAGTLYQKRFCAHFDWRSGAVAQFLPTAIVTGIVVFTGNDLRIDWSGDFIFALAWLVLALSIGAISLLNWLIRHGSARCVLVVAAVKVPVELHLGPARAVHVDALAWRADHCGGD